MLGESRFAWVVFKPVGRTYVARHLGMPFGLSYVVHSFHRVGEFVSKNYRKVFVATFTRFFDDQKGLDDPEVHWMATR